MTRQPQDSFLLPMAGRGASWSVAAVIGAAAAAWAFLAWLVFDMDSELAQLTMPGSSDWSGASIAAIGFMWAVMMAAMMLPSALPAILTFTRLSVRAGEPARAATFSGGYLTAWTVFSVVATAIQWGLQAVGWVDPMIVSRSPWLSAVLLAGAGLYQFTAVKRACLAQCRSPVGMLVSHWRSGILGALQMGLRFGAFCLGCCWALMALLFVGGVMNLAWITALSIVVAIERLVPGAHRTAMLLGWGLLAAGAVKLATSIA